jgi:hypothetical protein
MLQKELAIQIRRNKMAGINRIHGGVTAEFMLSAYQQTFLKITGTNVGTADSVNGTTGAITDGNFSKAIRTIQTIATISWIGPRHNDGFVVLVDGATAQPDGPAYDTNGTPDVPARLKAILDTATGVTTTVVVPGMLAADVA